MNLTKEQFDEWKSHPVTIEIFTSISKVRQELLETFSDGCTIGQRADITHGLSSRLVGQIDGLNQLLNITFEDDEQIDF